MRKFFIAPILVLIFFASAFAQTDKILPCPTIDVSGPAGSFEPGDTVTFTVSVDDKKSDEYIYDWTISSGTIVEGRGEKIIRVYTDREPEAGVSLVATVEIKGLPEGCPSKFSAKFSVDPAPPTCGLSITLDEYGKISLRDEKARLSVVALELQNNNERIAVFILYHNKKDSSSTLQKRISRISDYLTQSHKIPKERLKFISGGEADVISTRIYLARSAEGFENLK